MVETRRTSRRLQARATTSPSPSPMSSPAARKSRRTPSPSPRSRAKKPQDASETASDESAQEIPVEETHADAETQQRTEAAIDSETESDKDQEKAADQEKEQTQEQDTEEEDVDQYAFLAASGLNLCTKSSAPSLSTAPLAATPAPSAETLKRRLVPNQLDSGAAQYQEFFNFEGSRRSQAATLRADARAAEEAKVLAAGRKAVAHSDRQRTESQHKKSAGRRWFNFESDEMTDDTRRDFALLRMRNYLDPKKFYKSSDHSRALPKHFQMGVVIQGAHEFHSARLTKKQRRKTFTDEIMADEAVVQYTHRVAGNIQKARSNQGGKKRRRN
ncbi:hypothetical protein PHYPSEUDO_005891 [Phytophthora pseudosyringae]|uniref:Fcf2 pre-rRNA processing C-terminal domain-containing protein n=1 Tax=Phytophthora pseudosyringae TaxID=221518 RepID=A0A8T1WFQ8_9STRA|nr:hypothetical protein PHYPSEUDO_005891 [Phytophthora pseudosyringae]